MSETKDMEGFELVSRNEKKDASPNTEKDDFWDIEMLLPKSKVAPRRAPGATDTTEILFEPPQKRSSAFANSAPTQDSPLNLNPEEGEVIVRHFVPPHTGAELEIGNSASEKPIIAYENTGGLIHRVRVFVWSSRYHYYRDFCADAARYLGSEPEKTYESPVPFFSYVPQYSQLNKEQLDFYFYWRQAFRRGETPKVDDSYLYLYIYELINTAGHETEPEEGLRMLYRLFRTYGRQNARLSRLLSEWIIDYSLIFRLSVPDEERSESGFYRTYDTTLKEFYISSPGNETAGYSELLLRFCSAYDYKKSHFYTGNNRAYFDRYLPGALSAVIQQYSSGARLFSETGMRDSHMIRNAFEQALCSYRIRYRIEVDYASFSRSHEMRYLVSDILKYTENRLRAFLGIKSRLTVYSLSTEVRKCIDRYCDESFPRKAAESILRKKEEPPAYEKLYDLPKAPLSVSHAAEIELDSWETTRRLTEAFSEETSDGGDSFDFQKNIPVPKETEKQEDRETDPCREDCENLSLQSILGAYYPFAEAAYREDFSFQHAFSAERGMLTDLVADHINELLSDTLGDILLVEEGSGYAVIEDYRSLFTID